MKLLTKIKGKLETENAKLLGQLNSLLKQNQDLLVKSLRSTTQLKDKEEELRQQVDSWTREREALTGELEQARSKKGFLRFFKKKVGVFSLPEMAAAEGRGDHAVGTITLGCAC